VPGPVTSDRSEGCHRLIQDGAKLVHRLEDILEELPVPYRDALRLVSPRASGRGPAPDPPPVATDPDEMVVLGLLDEARAHHVDRLAEAAPFGLGRLQLALLGLEVRGAIDSLPGGHYRRRDR
jgi:DNA processing protein